MNHSPRIGKVLSNKVPKFRTTNWKIFLSFCESKFKSSAKITPTTATPSFILRLRIKSVSISGWKLISMMRYKECCSPFLDTFDISILFLSRPYIGSQTRAATIFRLDSTLYLQTHTHKSSLIWPIIFELRISFIAEKAKWKIFFYYKPNSTHTELVLTFY